MAQDTAADAAPAVPSENPGTKSWPVLSPVERRVLGVLVEKAKTTPDAYPLSMNALTTGCNQKSNREPLLNLSDVDVEEGLVGLQKQQLVGKIVGGRVERWRHFLYESWRVNKVELAVLTELLLRGPQTEGELRGRASRMEPIADLDALRGVLRILKERGLIVYLTPEGRRGTTLTHAFHTPAELEQLRAGTGLEPPDGITSTAQVPLSNDASRANEELREIRDDIADLRTGFADLQVQVADLAAQLRDLKASLGG